MSSARRLLGLLALLLMTVFVQAQTPRSEDDPRNLAPTVNGGTGLFTVYDAQTLRRGEFNFGFFANYFHRDPGDAHFQVYTTNVQAGIADWLEVFASIEAQKVITVGRPEVLSGFYFPNVRPIKVGTNTYIPLPGGRVAIDRITGVPIIIGADPCNNGGFPGPCTTTNGQIGPFVARPSGNETAVYVGMGAPVGGILPAIPSNLVPSYLPNAPFISRFTGAGVGDIYLGAKVRLTPANNAFGIALIPTFKIPTTRKLNTGLERGRGTGAFDYGLTLALDGRLNKYINLSTNIGYIRKGDPKAEDMNVGGGIGVIQGFGRSGRALDLPDEWRSGIGVDFPLSQYLQFAVEVDATKYVGSRTPSLLRNDPVDLIAGARIYPARWFAIHAAYQRHLNWIENFANSKSSPNGFIFGLSIGHVNDRAPAVLPNQPPTVTLEVGAVTAVAANRRRESAATVCVSDTVALSARASDPDGDTLLYKWSTTGGRIVGEGANVTFDSTGLAPGDYTVTVEVDDGCGCVAFDSKTVRVSDCPLNIVCFNPTVDVTPASSTVNAGEAVNFSTSGVTGGQNYGNVTYNWTTSAGTIQGSGTSARLDTTGVPAGTSISVTLTATGETGNCSASGSATVTIATPPAKPVATSAGSCTTFKNNSARVDNACKLVLSDAARQLQSDPQAQLIVDSYKGQNERPADLDLQRGKNVRDRLADGGLGITIDPNRIVVRPSGVTPDGSQIKLTIVPAGADTPAGAQPATLGDVTPEKKAAPARKGKARKRRR